MLKRISWPLFVVIIATMALSVGCSKGTTDSSGDEAFEILTTYMADNSMDLPDILSGWIVPASDAAGNEDNYYIMDIRSAEDYATGHISGAVNSSLGNILTDASLGSKPILVVCYTGQSAAHAVVALRLSGYSDAKSLKFGMSSWNADFDKWTSNTGNIADGDASWTTDATTAVKVSASPVLSTSSSEGAAILAGRVAAMLSGGFKGIAAADVLGVPGVYFVNNYWAQSDVDTYGHIAGASRIKEDLTIAADGFKYLDPGETIVTYCWTGQTSSIVTAYLTVLGYDAKSLKFGVNAMIYDQLTSGKWTESANYDYVTD